jgi:hypothetical protein
MSKFRKNNDDDDRVGTGPLILIVAGLAAELGRRLAIMYSELDDDHDDEEYEQLEG